MKIKTVSQAIQLLLNLICVLLLIVPLSEVYVPYEFNAKWENQYLLSSIENILLFAPFYITWILYQWTQKPKLKKGLKILALLISGLYILYIFILVAMPIQDYFIGLGLHLCLLLFPLLVLMSLFQRSEKRRKIG